MPSTTYAILASALPVLQGPGAARYVNAVGVDPDSPFGAKVIATGDTTTVPQKLNKNALELDYALRAGSPGYGVIEGLTFSGSALTITVAPGKAAIDGLIELSVATNVTVANGTNYVWFKRDGTLQVVTGSTTPPVLPACPIGIVIVAAGAVVNYDLSGVIYHGSLPYRRTGDVGKPTDTPTVTWCFIQHSQIASYLWDGTKYIELDRQKIAVVPLTASDAAAGVFSWQNPEIGAIAITAIEFDVQTPATGACSLDVGTTAASSATVSDNLIDGLDVHSAAGLYGIQDQAGANGKFRQRLASGKWVTASKDTGATAGLAGYAYIHYFLLN